MSKERDIYTIISAIRYQLANGIHTYSPCANECGNPARGGGVCAECEAKELAKIVGENKAHEFFDMTCEMNTLIHEMITMKKHHD